MTKITMTMEKFFFGHVSWRSHRAINEIEVYCDLLDHLQDKKESLETRGKDEEVTLINVQVVISSYAIEIAMKSFWALDHPDESVLHTHDLVKIFDGLKDETKKSLEGLQLTRQVLNKMPTPFTSNRYSMEHGSRDITLYPPPLLRQLAQLLRDKLRDRLEDDKKALFKSLKTSTD